MQGCCMVAIFIGLTSKHLRCGTHRWVFTHGSILCKDGSARKAKHHVFLEAAAYHFLHITKLTAVTFIEDNHHLLLHHLLKLFILTQYCWLHQVCQLLYGGNDDTTFLVFQLFQQYAATTIRVCTIFFEVVVLLHGLIVQVFSIYHKEHFLHSLIHRGKLSRFE